jgi:hypothetical protein
MARIRKDGTILLNDVQMATFQEIRTKADDNGVIHADIIAEYKSNVIRGIAKHGAMKLFRGKHYKIVADAVVILQPVPTPRAERSVETQLAA